jgi:O-antigen ligase
MKSKSNSVMRTPSGRTPSVSLLETLFLALPILALTPNFFIIPDLTYQGLATQEAVFAASALVFSIAGLIGVVRARETAPDRATAGMLLVLAAFVVWQMISLAWAPAVYQGARVAGIWLGFSVFFAAGVLCLRPRAASWLHWVLTAVCAILAVSVLYERWVFGEFLNGIFFSHGINAELMAMLLPLPLLHYLCSEKRGAAIASLAVVGLATTGLFVGLRRGAILAMSFTLVAIGLAVLLKTIRLRSRARLLVVLALLLIAGGVLGVRYRDAIVFRIQGATRLDSAEGGLQTRLRGWITAWEMGRRNALRGVGNAGYSSLYGPYRKYFVSDSRYDGIRRYAGAEDYDEIHAPLVHNEYLQVFVELGVIGLALALLFWVLVVRCLWRGRGDYRVLGVLLGLIAFGISSFTSGFSLRYTPGPFVLACLLALGFAFLRDAELAEAAESEPIAWPKAAAIGCALLPVIGCLLFAGRAYNVYASQQLQGRAHLKAPPLDFAFYPDSPASNDGLVRRYRDVLALDSENAGAHLGLGLLLFQMRKPAEAIPHLEFAHRHGYSRPFAYVLLAFAQEQSGNLAAASQTLADCVASFPHSVFARAAYGEILRKEGKGDLLRENQDVLYTLNKTEAQSWEMALRFKQADATAEAARRGLVPPDQLQPRMASALVGVRALHYLK